MELRVVDKPEKWLFTGLPNIPVMQKEHEELVKVLQDEGVKIHYLMKMMNNKPKLYILRDTAIVLDKRALTCHFYRSVRRVEEQLVKLRLKELGIKIAGHIFAPGFMKASDIFFTDKNHAFANVGLETNMNGIDHLKEILNINVTPIQMDNVPSTQFNFVNDIAVVSEELPYHPIYPILKEKELDIVIASKEQAEEMAINFLQIDDYKLVNVNSSLNKKLKMIGFDVIEVEIKELKKGNCGIRNIVLPFY